MVNKPRLSIDIYNQYVQDDKFVQWPHDPNERALLARAIIGRELIASFDSQIKWAIDLIENAQPQKPFLQRNKLSLQDELFRKNLHPMESHQKKVIRDLLRATSMGILFSTLVALDQSWFGKYDLVLSPSQAADKSSISLFTALPDELHDELNDWIISFSEFADEIVELVQHPQGWWHYRPKESFRS